MFPDNLREAKALDFSTLIFNPRVKGIKSDQPLKKWFDKIN